MVDEEPAEYEVVLTPQFLDDLACCVEYVANNLSSPLAAKQMYETIKTKVLALSVLPQAAPSYMSPITGNVRYVISYNKFDVHYCIEDDKVKVLGLKHQLQNSRWLN